MNQLYKFICDYKANHNGNSPSLAEARDAMCLGSMERVHYLLNRLVENHKVSIDGTRQSRNIEVVGSQWIPPASQ
jgi:SOS-response transcriptional repressor LexA